jgi:acetylornithine deacetylase/succinyl-diaminopimelate desuccinylase-like protein
VETLAAVDTVVFDKTGTLTRDAFALARSTTRADVQSADALAWARKRPIPGLAVDIVRLPGRTPVLWFDAPATPGAGVTTVLVYGHLDKQPEMSGWREGLGPWTPVLEDGKLYGRGGADDGYAMYAALAAIEALDAQRVPRPRCFGLIETCEESGSYDLPAYLAQLAPRMGPVDFVVGLDSGAGDYARAWATTSLRGMASGTLSVGVLTEGVHSGDASGVVPSSFRIVRELLERVEDGRDGRLRLDALHTTVPAERLDQAAATAAILGDTVFKRFRWAERDGSSTQPATTDPADALLARAWRPSLEVTAADGIPSLAAGGNTLRPHTAVKLSVRLPPTVDSRAALAALRDTLTADPPYAAQVTFTPDPVLVDGWNLAPLPERLVTLLEQAGRACFDGRDPAFLGQGGTIPLMALLTRSFPGAALLACGVQGPGTNAHGPNESLHVPYAVALTATLALVVGGW